MGLISAATGSISSVVGDQFKEYVTCPATDKNVLICRGVVNHGQGNNHPSDGIISNGSKIVVPKGYAMMIIDNGAIKEFTAEPGEFIWDTSSEPSIFEGGLFHGIGESIKRIGDRITYGGQTARDQRVYYINLLTILDNKFGSTQSETIFDPVYGTVEITYNGEYSFRVVDPTVLVAKIIGANASDEVTVDEVVGGQLKSQFANQVSVCISDLMVKNNISFNAIQSYKNDVISVMNNLLDETWTQQYGLAIEDVTLRINATEESKEIIRQYSQEKSRGELYANNPQGLMAAATADAMKAGASNENGAMMGFMGMNMAQTVGGNAMNAAAGITPSAPQTPPVGQGTTPETVDINNSIPVKESVPTSAPDAEGANVSPVAKFCTNCGSPINGNFCGNCGTPVAK